MARRETGLFQVSNTEMSVYKECKRRWYLEYYLRLIRKFTSPRIAADTGSAVHEALHEYYVAGGRKNHEAAKDLAMSHLTASRDRELARDITPEDIASLKEIYAVAEICAKGYFEWVDETHADEGWTIQGSEERLVVDGPIEGTQIKGFIDIWGTHDRSGDLLVVDTKVVQNFGDTMKTLHLNEQAPLYAILSKIVDNQPGRGFRVVWNMIKRNKQTKGKAKPPFYQRYELAINDDQLDQFYAQLQGQIADMLETERRLNEGEPHYMVAYPTPSRDCSWKCPYLSICGAMNDPRTDVDWIIKNNYTTWEALDAQKREAELESLVEITSKEETIVNE